MSGGLPGTTEILSDAAAVAVRAAELVVETLAGEPLQPRPSICLAGGSTPKRLYRLLGEPPWRQRMPWERLHWFWGDERVVPPDDPDSNSGMARAALLDQAGLDASTIHPMPTGEGASRGAEVYETMLRTWRSMQAPDAPLFDVVILGLGPDGHTASLFPGRPEVEQHERWVVPVAVAGQPPYTPRITLTPSALGSGRLVLVLVTGSEKRQALERLRAGEDLPPRRIAPAGRLVWIVDAAASGEDAT